MSLAGVSLAGLADYLLALPGLSHKRDLDAVAPGFTASAVPNGDDTAAIEDHDGYQLFAIEGLVSAFVERQPWFAGYSAVMVNVSDIHAMGGRPLAVVDALWSRDLARAEALLAGIHAAAEAYGVPVVGGHSNLRAEREQLAVAILGRARRLLSSFAARPDDHLVAAIDLRGRFEEPFDHWNASVGAPPARLRADLELLPRLAEEGLCAAAKDISMAGPIGTALMLLECSGLGATLDPWAVPRPKGVGLERWLASFPSYGFLLSVAPGQLKAVLARFHAHGIDAAAFGRCDDSGVVRLVHGEASQPLWNFHREALLGCGPFGAGSARHRDWTSRPRS